MTIFQIKSPSECRPRWASNPIPVWSPIDQFSEGTGIVLPPVVSNADQLLMFSSVVIAFGGTLLGGGSLLGQVARNSARLTGRVAAESLIPGGTEAAAVDGLAETSLGGAGAALIRLPKSELGRDVLHLLRTASASAPFAGDLVLDEVVLTGQEWVPGAVALAAGVAALSGHHVTASSWDGMSYDSWLPQIRLSIEREVGDGTSTLAPAARGVMLGTAFFYNLEKLKSILDSPFGKELTRIWIELTRLVKSTTGGPGGPESLWKRLMKRIRAWFNRNLTSWPDSKFTLNLFGVFLNTLLRCLKLGWLLLRNWTKVWNLLKPFIPFFGRYAWVDRATERVINLLFGNISRGVTGYAGLLWRIPTKVVVSYQLSREVDALIFFLFLWIDRTIERLTGHRDPSKISKFLASAVSELHGLPSWAHASAISRVHAEALERTTRSLSYSSAILVSEPSVYSLVISWIIALLIGVSESEEDLNRRVEGILKWTP